jgi:hypothetical protein
MLMASALPADSGPHGETAARQQRGGGDPANPEAGFPLVAAMSRLEAAPALAKVAPRVASYSTGATFHPSGDPPPRLHPQMGAARHGHTP